MAAEQGKDGFPLCKRHLLWVISLQSRWERDKGETRVVPWIWGGIGVWVVRCCRSSTVGTLQNGTLAGRVLEVQANCSFRTPLLFMSPQPQYICDSFPNALCQEQLCHGSQLPAMATEEETSSENINFGKNPLCFVSSPPIPCNPNDTNE